MIFHGESYLWVAPDLATRDGSVLAGFHSGVEILFEVPQLLVAEVIPNQVPASHCSWEARIG